MKKGLEAAKICFNRRMLRIPRTEHDRKLLKGIENIKNVFCINKMKKNS